ncbi:NlpC/P60 family protein [Streptomyces sp. NPDC050504]|uniref:C40 family peptidase n=1 Tax=Streptomyces sp. NPDC050504 TaxID=3365618 RepID=UPI0037AEA419
MAAHRRPKQRPLSGPVARTAATLAIAGAATATTLEGPVHAEPRPTPAQVKAKVDRLYQEAEAATEKYNGTKEQAKAAQRQLGELRDEAARRTARLNSARNALGSLAAAQYRAGSMDSTVQLVLSSRPDDYLQRASLAERAGDRQAAAVGAVRRQLAEIAQLRAKAESRLATLKKRQADLAVQKKAIRSRLAAASELLDQLTAEQRAAYEADGAADVRSDRSAPRGSLRAPGSRAAQAVAFAHGALGSPYVWGATGPSAFDCSGLTQAAWRSAGVALPRTTYTQIDAGRRISRAELAPGDLIFFYPGVTHVGLYIGGGRMIHAPRPGTAVRIAPIDQMPFAGAVRVA